MSLQQHYDALVERHRLLKEKYRELEAANRRHHTTADALHQIHCSAACRNSAHREDGLGNAGITEEIVTHARHEMARLETWWRNRKHTLERAERARAGLATYGCYGCTHGRHKTQDLGRTGGCTYPGCRCMVNAERDAMLYELEGTTRAPAAGEGD